MFFAPAFADSWCLEYADSAPGKTSVVDALLGLMFAALVLRQIVMSDDAIMLRLDPNPNACIR